jgi:hypothetical protein
VSDVKRFVEILEKMGKLEVDSMQQSPLPRHKDINSFIKQIEGRIKNNEDLIFILKETLKSLQSFDFQEGDVVVSKTEGNGIVMGIGLGEDGHTSKIDEDFPNKFYVLIATKKGYAKVSPNDIVPYTKAAKVLYDKK